MYKTENEVIPFGCRARWQTGIIQSSSSKRNVNLSSHSHKKIPSQELREQGELTIVPGYSIITRKDILTRTENFVLSAPHLPELHSAQTHCLLGRRKGMCAWNLALKTTNCPVTEKYKDSQNAVAPDYSLVQ